MMEDEISGLWHHMRLGVPVIKLKCIDPVRLVVVSVQFALGMSIWTGERKKKKKKKEQGTNFTILMKAEVFCCCLTAKGMFVRICAVVE